MAKDAEEGSEQSAVQTQSPAPAKAKPAPSKAQKSAKTEPNKTNASTTAKKSVKAKPVAAAQKQHKAEDDEIPMDAAAIKAYSSVIADAAEDSEPAVPVQYNAVLDEGETHRGDDKLIGSDPMGSMIQNEITSIKMASIKAAQDDWNEKQKW